MIGCGRAHARRSALGLLFFVIAAAPAHATDDGGPAWRAAHQLVNAQLPSGLFAFEHDFVLGGRPPDTERGTGKLAFITREAGTAYGLSNYLLHHNDVAVRTALVAALHNLGELSVPIAKATGQDALDATGLLALPFGRYKLRNALHWLGLLYHPTGEGRLVSYDRTYETAWGGATALALLSELQFYRASVDPQFVRLGRSWLTGLLVLYDSRGFRELPESIDENALSNGETWLAFATYVRSFPDDSAAAAIAIRLDDYMMRTYAANPNYGFYTWGTKAAALRLEATSDVKFHRFIARQTRAFLNGIGPPVDPSENSCDAVEGLVTALHVLTSVADPDRDLLQRLRRRIDSEMEKNRSLQIEPGQTRIDLGNSTFLSSPSLADYAGAFLAGTHHPYVRVDYTVHCMTALLELGNPLR